MWRAVWQYSSAGAGGRITETLLAKSAGLGDGNTEVGGRCGGLAVTLTVPLLNNRSVVRKPVMVDSHHTYFGHKLASILFASIPVFTLDLDEVVNRLVVALCGGVGSFIALALDRPATWQDGAVRLGVGFAACALFVPYLATKWAIKTHTDVNLDSIIALAGVVGISSWYLMGSLFRFLKWLQNSDIVGTIIKIKTGVGPGATVTPPPVVVEKTPSGVVVSVNPDKPADPNHPPARRKEDQKPV